jgi:ArsR family transcriptional regulator, arsenate/arsenite/antimonite-responsive transcriptional repressor / arsenate reductase (thioredoxin)
LLVALARSDRRVRELVGALGQPENLISYHLGRLRKWGLVSARRSSADGRDAYYRLELARCGGLLTDAASALHPALRLSLPARPVLTVPIRVLFLCTGNSARSQMAQALLETAGEGMVEVRSAGSHPKPMHPNAVRALLERGIDISGRRSRAIGEVVDEHFDYVITLCDRVREVCPDFPSPTRMIHWSIEDPASEPGTDRETYPAFERTASELENRIRHQLYRFAVELPEELISGKPPHS